jgi:hypothetical protein
LKNDYLINYDIKNVKDLQRALKEIQILINEERPVAGLGFKTPKEYEEELKDIPMSERTKKICYDFSIHYPTRQRVF